jgi:hypothetical protein
MFCYSLFGRITFLKVHKDKALILRNYVYGVREKLCLNSSSKLGELVRSAAFETVTNAIGVLPAVFKQNIAVGVVSVVAQCIPVDWSEIKKGF